MNDKIGVAISTTGDRHRLDMLAASVAFWDAVIPDGSSLFVTVDGDEQAVDRAAHAVDEWTGSVFQVGQPFLPSTVGLRTGPHVARDGHLGVAVNKNTGLELLMGHIGLHPVEHLFLSDDDTWPLSAAALDLHVSGNLDHSMVCWGQHRLGWITDGYAEWEWPRGSMLYTRRHVVDVVGGMVEAFGPGGHEHVEWSRRIHQAGLTPALYPSPTQYAEGEAMGAKSYWHAEDMPKPGEGIGAYHYRKRLITSVRRTDDDWPKIDKIMTARDGDISFVPYDAGVNGRASATLYHKSQSLGA